MDETTLERLASLVKGMHDQGMSVKQIEDNLSQMGISSDDIAAILNRSGLKPSASDVHEAVTTLQKTISTGEAVKPVMDKLSETEQHFERLHNKVDMLHEKNAEISNKIDDIAKVVSEINEIKNELVEIKAQLEAIKKLQQDLLEVNRRVLAGNL